MRGRVPASRPQTRCSDLRADISILRGTYQVNNAQKMIELVFTFYVPDIGLPVGNPQMYLR